MKDKYKLLIFLTLIILYAIAHFLVFVIFRPFGGITFGSDAKETFCLLQRGCSIENAFFSCSDDYINPHLKRWKNFAGCNSSTPGYNESTGRIFINSCSCGGIM